MRTRALVLILGLAACGPTAVIDGHNDGDGDDDAPAGGDAGPPDPEQPTGADAGGGCLTSLPLEGNLPPRILIVLDRSGSMEEIWAPTTTAIKQVVLELQDQVGFGFSYFPTSDTGGDACKVDPVAVPVADLNHDPIAAAIDATGPYGLTPTHAAIAEAGAYLTALADPNPKYVILITDGIPNCAPGPNCACPPGFTKNAAEQCVLDGGGPYDYYSCDITGDLSINATYWAIADLAAAGIHTFVFGLPSAGFSDFGLNVLAPAGAEARPGPTKYYPASTPAELESMLASLSAGLISCSFQLPDGVTDVLGVSIDGQPVPRDTTHQDGWDYDGAGGIRLYGGWCDLLQGTPAAEVEAMFVCPPQP